MDSFVNHHHHVSKLTVVKWSFVSYHHHGSKLNVVKWIALSVIIIMSAS
jgi:hypothetical protein